MIFSFTYDLMMQVREVWSVYYLCEGFVSVWCTEHQAGSSRAPVESCLYQLQPANGFISQAGIGNFIFYDN